MVPLTCAVCSEGFDTPSGLHRHKYHYTDLKFTCETCGERFPFESQLKDHRVKHLMNRGHSCFAKDCGRLFKNKSSLIRHIKVHDGKNYPCPEEGCMYSSNTETQPQGTHDSAHWTHIHIAVCIVDKLLSTTPKWLDTLTTKYVILRSDILCQNGKN